MNKIVKRAVAKMVAAFSHVGMTVNTVPRLDEHIRDSTKQMHLHRWGGTVAVNALERSLRETKPFLQWKIRRVFVTLVRMFSWKRMLDGRIVDRPPFDNFATET